MIYIFSVFILFEYNNSILLLVLFLCLVVEGFTFIYLCFYLFLFLFLFVVDDDVCILDIHKIYIFLIAT